MSSIKLSYFPLRGRGEVSRLVLHAAKKDFVDNRVNKPDWPALKPNTPFGSLPVLEVDGEQFGQGIAVASFLARENGLYGSSNVDALRIDQIHQLREDLIIEEIKVFKEQDESKKAEMVKDMNENTYPRIVGHFNRLIAENKKRNASSQFAVGSKLSLADIVIFEGTTTLSESNPSFLDNYPEVAALRKVVSEQDGVKQYVEKRGKTPL